MKIVRHKKGQFIVLAALTVAIMIISIGIIMYGTVTYFKHERWQEYLMIIDNIELGSQRVVEISLANYTSTFNDRQVLNKSLNQWQTNLTKAYPGFGVALTCSDATIGNGTKNVTSQINNTMHFSSANANLNIDMTSVGLTGYEFVASAFLGAILNATYDSNDLVIFIAVEKESLTPVTNLNKNSFSINNESLANINSTLTHSYEMDNGVLRVIYRIVILNDPRFSGLSNAIVAVVDTRDIKVIANSTVT
jgi:hypothetical protein